VKHFAFLGTVVAGLAGAILGVDRDGCARTTRVDPAPAPAAAPVPAPAEGPSGAPPSASDAALVTAPALAIDGPHELALEPGRPILYAFPGDVARPLRLVAHLHGMCGGPSYACGKWLASGVAIGAVVCPTGNARCGDSGVGPPSWEAPTWSELVATMDRDLEASIAKVEAKHRGSIRREGAVLTGYSRGAYAAAVIARKHKDRWPYLVLIEANVTLGAEALRAAGVRAVALVAGEQGNEIAGMRATAEALDRDGFPARLVVMKKTGHLYSEDMEDVMRDALAFVLGY
jgi:hypothetical protein